MFLLKVQQTLFYRLETIFFNRNSFVLVLGHISLVGLYLIEIKLFPWFSFGILMTIILACEVFLQELFLQVCVGSSSMILFQLNRNQVEITPGCWRYGEKDSLNFSSYPTRCLLYLIWWLCYLFLFFSCNGQPLHSTHVRGVCGTIIFLWLHSKSSL